MKAAALTLLLWLVTLAAGALGGWAYARSQYQASTHTALQQALARERTAQAQGEAATQELNQHLQALREHTQQQIKNALPNVTTDRPCLGAAAVRVLERAEAFTEPAAALPESAQRTAGADAGVATDRAVAEWIAGAAEQYQACRERIDALRQWHDQRLRD